MSAEIDTGFSERRCMKCGKLICESMGCVVARDFNEYNRSMEEGKTPKGIRERCALCVEAILLSQEDFL